MPIDPTGTTPGVTKPNDNPDHIHLTCKNPQCDSIVAIEVKMPGQTPGTRMYQCVKCKRTWGIAVGGGVDL
jgi:hypothetical protein